MSATSSSGLEVSFLVMVKEIERNYQSLSKQLKIRIEKWIVKLVTSGVENYVWRKSRNEYAKLLLHMVLLKRLSDPFHILPPDGQLHQFPGYLSSSNYHNKAADANQISFWDEIYSRLAERMASTRITSSVNDHNSAASYDDNFMVNEANFRREAKQSRTQNTEHQLRIRYLEQQLRDEKLHYGLQVQRLQDAHKVEMNAYAEVINSSSSVLHCSPHDISTLLCHDSIRYKASFPIEGSRTPLKSEDGLYNLGDEISQPDNDLKPSPETTKNAMSEIDISPSCNRLRLYQDSSEISGSNCFENRDLPFSSSSVSLYDTDPLSSDGLPHYLPRPGTKYQMTSPGISRLFSQSYSLDLPKRNLRLQESLLPLPSRNNLSSTKVFDVPRLGPIDADDRMQFDESFLEYIDKFQNELKRIHALSPLIKS